MKNIIAILITVTSLVWSYGQSLEQPNVQIADLSKGLFVVGDYDGNGSNDTLTYKSVSKITGKRIWKFEYTNDSDKQSNYCALEPELVLYSSNSDLTEFVLTDNCQNFGLQAMANLGDIDGDGGDEIALNFNWFGRNVPSYFLILSYCKDSWIVADTLPLYYEIWDDGGEGYQYVDIDQLIDWEGSPEIPRSNYIRKDGTKVKIVINKKGC